MEILTRAGIALAIIFAGLGLYWFVNDRIKLRTRPLLHDLGPLRPMTFTLVYFVSPDCIPCATIQRPAIQKLSHFLEGAVQVFEFDVTQHPDLARRWGVMRVPTTFIIAPNGQVRHVNHGAASFEKLVAQIHSKP